MSLTSSWQDNAIRWFSRNAPGVKIAVEVNRRMPRVRGLPAFGNHEIHVNDVHWIVEDESALAQYGTAKPSKADLAIANNVAALVEDRRDHPARHRHHSDGYRPLADRAKRAGHS